MRLDTAKAEARPCAAPGTPGEAGSFAAEYHRYCAVLLKEDAQNPIARPGAGETEGAQVADAVNERMAQRRRQICDHMTDWLYDQGGTVGQWPQPDSGCRLPYRLWGRAKQKFQAGFSYFGGPFAYDAACGRLVRQTPALCRQELPYGGVAPVEPEKPAEPEEGPAVRKCMEKFKQDYEAELANAPAELARAEAELEEARGRTDFRPPEERAVTAAQSALKEARRRERLPLPTVLAGLLLLGTVPGYIFALMGGMPEAMDAALQAKVGGGGWQSILYLAAGILLYLPQMPVWLVGMLGGTSVVWRVIVVLITLAVELVALAFLLEFLGGNKVWQRIGFWWSDLTNRGARVRNAKADLRAAKQAAAAAGGDRQGYMRQAETEAGQRVRQLEQRVEELRRAKSDAGNMKLWHDRFEEFKKTPEYSRAVRQDAQAGARYKEALADYEAALGRYRDAYRQYEEKTALCRSWQAAWYDCLCSRGITADSAGQ